MSGVLNTIWMALQDAGLMAWQVWWALVLGFAISAVVQAWVPRERIQNALAGSGLGPVARATGLGAASSSCSYAAIAIAKSLFQKGAAASSALAFQFASTNLVWELGLVLWVLLGWQFALAEYVGGIVMIVLMAGLLRLFVSRRLEEQAREHARAADTGHQHHMAGEAMTCESGSGAAVSTSRMADRQLETRKAISGNQVANDAAVCPAQQPSARPAKPTTAALSRVTSTNSSGRASAVPARARRPARGVQDAVAKKRRGTRLVIASCLARLPASHERNALNCPRDVGETHRPACSHEKPTQWISPHELSTGDRVPSCG